MAKKTCKKCGSDNVSFQREQTASISGSTHSYKLNRSGHGLIWWICIGWWYVPFMAMFKFIMFLGTLGLCSFFFRRKNERIRGKTVTANKTINRTMAICQDCGYSWKA